MSDDWPRRSRASAGSAGAAVTGGMNGGLAGGVPAGVLLFVSAAIHCAGGRRRCRRRAPRGWRYKRPEFVLRVARPAAVRAAAGEPRRVAAAANQARGGVGMPVENRIRHRRSGAVAAAPTRSAAAAGKVLMGAGVARPDRRNRARHCRNRPLRRWVAGQYHIGSRQNSPAERQPRIGARAARALPLHAAPG